MRNLVSFLIGLSIIPAVLHAAETGQSSGSGQKQPVTIVVDASAFLDNIPLHDTLIDGVGGRGGGGGRGGARGATDGVAQGPAAEGARATAPESSTGAGEAAGGTGGRRGGGGRGAGAGADNTPSGALFFNNYGIVFGTEANLLCVKEIPEAGTYHLFVRSQGSGRSSFRVSVNGKLSSVGFGNTPSLTLTNGGSFELSKGPSRIILTRIVQGATFDALFLTKNADLKEEDLPALQFSPEAVVLKEYNTGGGTPKFGDVDGDGKMDILSVGRTGSATVYNHGGTKLWSYEPTGDGPRLDPGFEPPGLVWDLDRDGKAEVIHWRVEGDKEKLVVADGMTGAVKYSTDWPTPPAPHTYYNFRLAIANFTGGYPNDIVVFTDSGDNYKSVAAYTWDLKKRWDHVEHLRKDHLGHYAYPYDVNGDGIDEVFVSALALDAKGNKLWDRFDVFFDNHDHCDSFRFGDITGDGRPELLCPLSDVGVAVFDALTGRILWQHPAAHGQQLEWGNFLAGQTGPQIAVNGRFYSNGQSGGLSALIYWFDKNGNLLKTWPSRPLSGNTDFVKGDWRGDGAQVLFWHKFKMNPDGTGELYFPDTVVHMFDFDGNGTDDVITRGGGGVRVYTYKYATPHPERVLKDPNVLRWKVANHTHY